MYCGIINSVTKLHLVGYCYWVILRCTDTWILNSIFNYTAKGTSYLSRCIFTSVDNDVLLLGFLRRVILKFWVLKLNRKIGMMRCFGRKCCLLVRGDWSRCRWKLKWLRQGGCTRPSFLLPQLLFEILATFLHNRHIFSTKSLQHACEPWWLVYRAS